MDAAAAYAALFPGSETYFASGSNNAGEINGLALSGYNVGVSACELAEPALARLEELAHGPTLVFVDSGAFGEIDFTGAEGPKVKKLITPREWVKRLDIYRRLAETLGRRLYCVAPDMVGFQAETLERLATYADRIAELRALGANVIVPVQKGALSMPEFADRAAEILGTRDVIWGIPSKKDATKLEDVRTFAEWLHTTGPATRVHLLGLGPSSKRFAPVYSAIATASPGTTIFSDSVRITALVGRGTLRKDGTRSPPRPLTAAQDAVAAHAAATGEPLSFFQKKSAAIVTVFHAQNRTDAQEARRRGWFDPELESAPGVPLEPGCIEYGPGGPFGDDAQEVATPGHQESLPISGRITCKARRSCYSSPVAGDEPQDETGPNPEEPKMTATPAATTTKPATKKPAVTVELYRGFSVSQIIRRGAVLEHSEEARAAGLGYAFHALPAVGDVLDAWKARIAAEECQDHPTTLGELRMLADGTLSRGKGGLRMVYRAFGNLLRQWVPHPPRNVARVVDTLPADLSVDPKLGHSPKACAYNAFLRMGKGFV